MFLDLSHFEYKPVMLDRTPGAQDGQPLTLDMTLATALAASQHGYVLSLVNAAGTNLPIVGRVQADHEYPVCERGQEHF